MTPLRVHVVSESAQFSLTLFGLPLLFVLFFGAYAFFVLFLFLFRFVLFSFFLWSFVFFSFQLYLGCWRAYAAPVVFSTIGIALHCLLPSLHYDVISLCRGV